MTSNILKSHGMKQFLGAGIGMIAATALYFLIQQLPSSGITPALLIDANSAISDNAHRVRVNDKNIDESTLARITARADQVSDQLHAAAGTVASSETVSSPAAVVDHADRTAWLAMRAAQRSANAKLEVSSSSARLIAGVQLPRQPTYLDAVIEQVKNNPPVQYSPPEITAEPEPENEPEPQPVPVILKPVERLTNSGVGLNLMIVVSLFLAFTIIPAERKKALIVALR